MAGPFCFAREISALMLVRFAKAHYVLPSLPHSLLRIRLSYGYIHHMVGRLCGGR